MKPFYLLLIIIIVLNITASAQNEISYINSTFKDVSGKVKTCYTESYPVKKIGDSLVKDYSREGRLFGSPNYNYLVFDEHRCLIEMYRSYDPVKQDNHGKFIYSYNRRYRLISTIEYDEAGKKHLYTKTRKTASGYVTKTIYFLEGKRRLVHLTKADKRDSVLMDISYRATNDGYYFVAFHYSYNDSGLKTAEIKTINNRNGPDSIITTYKYDLKGAGPAYKHCKDTYDTTLTTYGYDSLGNMTKLVEEERTRKINGIKAVQNQLSYSCKYVKDKLIDETYYYNDSSIRLNDKYFYDGVKKVKDVKIYHVIYPGVTDETDTTIYLYKDDYPVRYDCFSGKNKIHKVYTYETTYDGHGNVTKQIEYENGEPVHFIKQSFTYFK